MSFDRTSSSVTCFSSLSSRSETGMGLVLGNIHLYTLERWQGGLLYTLAIARRRGHTRDEVIETLAATLLHNPAPALFDMVPALREVLDVWVDEAQPFQWPDGWRPDPSAFRSGIDFSSDDMDEGELALLEAWYREVSGEVPRYVRYMAEFCPRLLKAYRHRFESTFRVLPKQMMGFLMLHWEVYRGHEDGIREAVLMARGLGMTRQQTLEAINSVFSYAAHGGISNVDRAAGDILRSW